MGITRREPPPRRFKQLCPGYTTPAPEKPSSNARPRSSCGARPSRRRTATKVVVEPLDVALAVVLPVKEPVLDAECVHEGLPDADVVPVTVDVAPVLPV